MSDDSREVLGPMLAEKLASRGLGDEMFEVLMQKEKEGVRYGTLEESQEPDMPKSVRDSALFFLKWCAHQNPHDPLALTNYINAVQLFDVAAPNSIGTENDLGPVWTFAAAAWSLSFKMNASNQVPEGLLLKLASMAEMLLGRPTVMAADIRQQEETILLTCNLSACALTMWCTFFFARLDAILNGVLAREGHVAHLHMILSKVLTMAAESVRFSRRSSPYIVVAGSFCLALIVAEVVPVSDVIDLEMSQTSTQALDAESVEAKLAWMKRNLKYRYLTCSVPSMALVAATVVALRSNFQDMKLTTTRLVNQILLPHKQSDSS